MNKLKCAMKNTSFYVKSFFLIFFCLEEWDMRVIWEGWDNHMTERVCITHLFRLLVLQKIVLARITEITEVEIIR